MSSTILPVAPLDLEPRPAGRTKPADGAPRIGAPPREAVARDADADGADDEAKNPFLVTLGERVDVVMTGIADLQLGGTVARGSWVTVDAQGRGVAAAPAAGGRGGWAAGA